MTKTVAIHVYYDDQPESRAWPYSVARVDLAGDEIACDHAYDSLAAAWERGCELALEYGVPCIEYATAAAAANGTETDRYDPQEIGCTP